MKRDTQYNSGCEQNRPPNPFIQLGGQLIFSLGFYMVVPFLAIHLRDNLALAGGAIGLILGVRTFSQQGLYILGGILADRVGQRTMILTGCAVRVIGFLVLGVSDTLFLALIGACLTGVGGALFSPAISSLLAHAGTVSESLGGRTRAKTFALFAVANELGATGGPLLGALLLGIGFHAMAMSGAMLFLIVLVVLGLVLPGKMGNTIRSRPHEWKDSFHNPLFMGFVAAHSTYLFSLNQVYLALPVELQRSGGTDDDLALMFMLASLMVICFQLPINHLARRFRADISLPVGFLCLSIAFLVVAFSAPFDVSSSRIRLLPTILLVILLTLGQMIISPMTMDLVPRFAKGRALGVFYGTLASAGGFMVLVGNTVIGSLLDRALVPSQAAMQPWFLLSVLPAFSAVALFIILRRGAL